MSERDPTTDASNENETQRLHRLVLPMILDLLRSRGERPRRSSEQFVNNPLFTPPPQRPNRRHEEDTPTEDSQSDDMLIDPLPFSDVNTADDAAAANPSYDRDDDDNDTSPDDHSMQENEHEEGSETSSSLFNTTQESTHSSTPPSRRPRYRLVVYFEEREAPPTSSDDSSPDTYEGDEQAATSRPSSASNRPSRYVAIFSVDSDDHNMPIIHTAGLQNTPANFEDILNQLFTSYVPKGTPPAKQDVIDSLPTFSYCADHASQPKCAVCLEDFEDGTEVSELPCTHRFHGETCVKPWLKMHNSCPVCRYEMPVDDVEYEQSRKLRMAGRTAFDRPASEEDATNTMEELTPGPSTM